MKTNFAFVHLCCTTHMLDNTFVRQTEQLHSRQIIAVGHKRFSNNGAKYVEGNGGTASAGSPNQPTLPIFLPLDLPGHQQWCGDQ